MLRLVFLVVFVGIALHVRAQPFSMSLGIHTGITVPFTYDQGINNDPRYKAWFDVKFAPVGMAFSLDYNGFGMLATPGIVTLGQNFYVVNTVGGHDGLRKINLQYLNIPVGIKIHLIDLSFFKVSGVASVGVALLLDASDKISHGTTTLTFPPQTYPILPPGYTQEYDGVAVPSVSDLTVIAKDDYNPMQFFAALGVRADWDISEHWRISFDARGNYGWTDPRTDAYINHAATYKTLYDTPGKRKDMFAHLTIGIARYIEFDKKDRERSNRFKGSSRRYIPHKRSGPRRPGRR